MSREDEGLFKGMFFGVLLGVGIAWFLTTPEGKEVKKRLRSDGERFLARAKAALDQRLAEDFVEEDPS